MIASLGTEPQVVTISLDKLLEQGFDIKEVTVIYTQNHRVLEALETIREEFTSERYEDITLRKVNVIGKDGPIKDFHTNSDLRGLMSILYSEVRRVRKTKARLHFCLAGGRKVMGILGMVVSQLLFGPGDKVWYLVTEGWKPGVERKLHVEDDDKAWLLSVPVLRWDEAGTLIQTVSELNEPEEIMMWFNRLTQKGQYKRRAEFVRYWLTSAEKQVAYQVCLGLSNREIAKILNKSQQTVANQLGEVYAKLDEWLGYPANKVDRNVLIAEFAPYFRKLDDESKNE
ncbi:MAG: CRISPR-associated protein Csx14 [Bacteroidales bacterium]|nr:CRISPR-associated protein Csx14 [Bacteroidales bacterium]